MFTGTTELSRVVLVEPVAMSQFDDNPTVFPRESYVYDDEGDFLGAGAFGSVYRARNKDTGQLVALKVVNTPERLKARSVAMCMSRRPEPVWATGMTMALGDPGPVPRLICQVRAVTLLVQHGLSLPVVV